MRVLMTGVANGIGAACMAQMRADGAEVIGLDVEPGDWRQLDLSDLGAVREFHVDGAFDALVHTAGLPPRAEWESRILTVNFLGLRQLTEQVLPQLKQGGSIVSVASKAVSKWRENLGQVQRFIALDPGAVAKFVESEEIGPVRAYDLSKESLLVWTRQQVPRLNRLGLRANCVSPAAINTRLLDEFVEAFGDRAHKAMELSGRNGEPSEVAQAVAFLSSPSSSWVRGINLVVDGGLDARLDCLTLGIEEVF